MQNINIGQIHLEVANKNWCSQPLMGDFSVHIYEDSRATTNFTGFRLKKQSKKS